MPNNAWLLSVFVTLFVSLSSASAQQIVLEPRSKALKNKSIRAHTMAIYQYEGANENGPRHRNRMFPRIMRKAYEKGMADNASISVVVADQAAIEWFKIATPIMEFLPTSLSSTVEVNWFTRDQSVGDADSVKEYWLFPFGNPERSLEDATTQDIQWSYETIESTLTRYHILKTKGYKVSFVLDMNDGGDTSPLAFWVLNNINARLLDDGKSAIPVQIVKVINGRSQMYPQTDLRTENLIMPASLEKRYPEYVTKFTDLIQPCNGPLRE